MAKRKRIPRKEKMLDTKRSKRGDKHARRKVKNRLIERVRNIGVLGGDISLSSG